MERLLSTDAPFAEGPGASLPDMSGERTAQSIGIVAAVEQRTIGACNSTGPNRIDRVTLVRAMKRATGAGAAIVKIPSALFDGLLRIFAMFDRNPPFTENQLEAAMDETFRRPVSTRIGLQF